MSKSDKNDPFKHPFDTSAPSLTKRAVDTTSLLSGNYWGELRAFVCLAKTRSLSGAAEMLGVSHATIGREVRRLQDLMGSQLFTLSHAGAHLTERGEQLASALLKLDQQLFTIESDLKAEKSDTQGTVRLGITDGLGAVFLVPELQRLKKSHPGIRVQVKSPGHLKNLRENQTDIMLSFAAADSDDFVSVPVGWLHFIPLVSKAYVDQHGLPNRRNLSEHFFVDTEIYSARGGPFEPWHAIKAQGTVIYECDASISYGMMVKAGLGIGLLANYNMMEPFAVPLDLNVHIKLRLYATVFKERLDSKPVKTIFTLLQDIFSEKSPWFSEELQLHCDDPRYKEGYSLLFNIGSGAR